jgi:uncharacterized protein (TIGR02246 family)
MTRKTRDVLTAALCVALMWAANGTAAESSRSADLSAVTGSADVFRDAYHKGDAKAIGALFSPAAEFIDSGGDIYHGSAAIETAFAELFAETQPGRMKIDVEAVRYLGPGVLAEEGTTTVIPNGQEAATKNRYVAIHVKQQDGKWLIVSARSQSLEFLAPGEHLKELAWLVGNWVDESDESRVETSWRWSDDGNFLIGEFNVGIEGISIMGGTHRIGWDPVRKQIRSWVFDSEGGFVEGYWSNLGDHWVMKSTGARPDGTVGSATFTYRRGGDDLFSLEMKDRIIGGEREPDMKITVVRQPPEPGQGINQR